MGQEFVAAMEEAGSRQNPHGGLPTGESPQWDEWLVIRLPVPREQARRARS